MNNSKKCKILLKTHDRVSGEYPNITEFIDTSMANICRSEKILQHLVFFLFALLLFDLVLIIVYG